MQRKRDEKGQRKEKKARKDNEKDEKTKKKNENGQVRKNGFSGQFNNVDVCASQTISDEW